MRNLSLQWMERIAGALEVDPEMLVRSESNDAPQVVARLGANGPDALEETQDALLVTQISGSGDPLIVLEIDYPHGEYRPGDQLWMRQIDPEDAAKAINRDVLVPKKAGRFAFGRLIDRRNDLGGILPPGHGEKQEVVSDPAWIGMAEMLVRRL
jgi:hypothetical protein